jgi:hypothetical protein
MKLVQFLPKWLPEEDEFHVMCMPASRPAFRVKLFGGREGPCYGFGNSIAEAAKKARIAREATK